MFKPTDDDLRRQEAGLTEELGDGSSSGCALEQKYESGKAPILGGIEPNDEELVLLAKRGDHDAFVTLTQRELASCLKRAYLIVRNRSDAEDQVQSAFARAFECLGQFRSEGTFSAWLGRIVQNQCMMLIRERRQAELVYVDLESESKGRLELVDQMANQEDYFGSCQVAKLLHREISRVPPLMRNVIRLRDIEGLPLAEVAAHLGVSVPAIKSRLMRARKELRGRLTKHCGPSGVRTLMARPTPSKVEHTYVS